jgi:large subunit ribosomal protein L3
MGDENVSVLNLEIVEIDQTNNLIYLKGAVPGARNGLVMLQMDGDLVIRQVATPVAEKTF